MAEFTDGYIHHYYSHRGTEAQRTRRNVGSLWRPFLDPSAPLSVPENAPPVLIPVVPGIQGWRNGLPLGLCVLALDPDFNAASLPPGDFLPPVLLAVAARGLYDLIAAAQQRARPAFSRIAKALKKSRWRRRGIYLTPVQVP